MIFYILYPGDTEADTINDRNKLGDISFNSFRPNEGYGILKNMLDEESSDLEEIRIIDSLGKRYSLEEFINSISKYDFNSKWIK